MGAVGRNPFPLIRYENDDTFSGKKGSEVYTVPDLTPNKSFGIWVKLNMHHTLSSMRRKVEYSDPLTPEDDLDFKLKADYDQHRDWWKSNAQIVLQCETSRGTCRVLKNRPTINVKIPPPPEQPFPIWNSDRRDHLFHVVEALDGHHTQATNGGYSRKPDGNKFTS
ncbi:hypothetical protein FBUS_02729 [Fasciolopsis buskii]|uniref:Uncharacterized protein n=1 Tax=Fasciolopsis buskii TaxID=27845 RepID=A0A8E0RLW5_9TREM|nr:hypothetical protein FBUS_02729 [Fasciolopsis buski]